MICRTVTFNPENEDVWPIWMAYTDIHEISRDTHLRNGNEQLLLERTLGVIVALD
jgi:hypothetical protein